MKKPTGKIVRIGGRWVPMIQRGTRQACWRQLWENGRPVYFISKQECFQWLARRREKVLKDLGFWEPTEPPPRKDWAKGLPSRIKV